MCAVDVAQRRWKTLQDKFARELKKKIRRVAIQLIRLLLGNS